MRLDKLKPMLRMAGDLARRRYPAVLYGRAASPRQLPPVFCLHSVTSAPFEAMLQRLTDDGYRTLTCDQYIERLRGGGAGGDGRELLLTFDDGVAQMWSVAWPLLEKYGQCATLFIIPGRVQPGDGPRRPTLREVWAGRAARGAIDSLDESDQPWCTWRELAEMQASGVIDCQSHTMMHSRVFTGRTITGFVSPDYLRRTHMHDMTLWPLPAGQSYAPPEPGWPLFANAPRMVAPGVHPSPALNRACAAFVQQQGGATFFEISGWEDRLHDVAKQFLAEHDDAILAESDADWRRALVDDLRLSRETIDTNLPGHRCSHLALPWGEGSAAAVDAARAAGFTSCFWGRVDDRLTNHVGDDPLRLARIGEDFIPCLPGRQRVGLTTVLMRKFRRAATGG